VKSPLILGNDVRVFPPADLAIVSNPAVIAVNQDPTGSSAARRWWYPTDTSGGAIQMWSGTLVSTTDTLWNDWVVLLINGNNNQTVMNATLADIFIDYGAAGTALQVKLAWEVRDLWADRMSDAEAKAVIDAAAGNGTMAGNGTTMINGRYNATEMSYAEGLLAKDERLLGNVTTTVSPSGTIVATVDAHGAAMFRLRAMPTAVTKRDEL